MCKYTENNYSITHHDWGIGKEDDETERMENECFFSKIILSISYITLHHSVKVMRNRKTESLLLAEIHFTEYWKHVQQLLILTE